jgi:two-component system response regulator YesN
MGIGFAQWNATVRLCEAKRLLSIADLSITAVALSIGYDDVTTFERAFMKTEGICPRDYRKRIAVLCNKRRNQDNKRRDHAPSID